MQACDHTSNPAAPTTMLLQVGSTWAVCSRTPVPIILARFNHRRDAAQWQSDHERRVAKPKAA